MKRAGWDEIIIHGASEKWIYILVDADRVEIRDATDLLGLDTYQTEEAKRDQFFIHDAPHRIAVILQAKGFAPPERNAC